MKTAHHGFLLIAVVTLLLWGCSSPRLLMPTPNVNLIQGNDPYHGLNPELKDTEVRLFYITDRKPEQDDQGSLRYGYIRSQSLAFGEAVVDLGADLTWEDLHLLSLMPHRRKPVKLVMRGVTELVRGPHTPLPYALVDGKIVEEPVMLERQQTSVQSFRRLLLERLALTPRKEVFVYIHGFHNGFDDAAFALAELWHFLGRIGVPMVYTWPAGYPGLFGYAYDRESSEFTVYHLREVLEIISGFPEVEKIHVIAHSRGTDIAVAALRELTLKTRAAGIDPRRKFKIENFVLAAPDLDLMVAEQRIDGDKLPMSVGRFTIYTSPDDKAIGFARKLFQSPQGRIGSFGLEDLTENLKAGMEFSAHRDFAIIQFTDTSDRLGLQRDRYGHSYFRNAPAVSSDLVLMLRDDLDPGSAGRPLEHLGYNFWRIPSRYPDASPPE
jgi:esterase/lipase superfamily enzyme